MNRSKAIIRNGAVGIASQCVTMILAFVMRSVFLKYIGEEMLGINSTFASVLEALSLSELGFQSAIIFMLYKPLQDQNKEKINSIVNLLKILYRYVGIFFFIASIALLPALKYILKGVDVTLEIQVYFLMQTSISSFSYFLAYPRSLLYADQKEYLTKLTDMLVNLFVSALIIVSVIVFNSYALYLGLRALGVIFSNLIIFRYYRKGYVFIHKVPLDRVLLREAWGNTKNIFIGRFAGFLYRSTANLAISALISTVMVAFYGNYQMILVNLRTFVDSAMTSMIPIIGNSLANTKSVEEKESFFKFYSHVRYLLALIVVIPFLLLIDLFIGCWLGEKYVLVSAIKWLMAADLYIHLVHTPCYEFITASGMFRDARNIELFGAGINLILTIVGIKMFGLVGVLLGMVVSQIFFWIGRSYLVYKKCLVRSKGQYLKYWMRESLYLLIFIVCLGFCYLAVNVLKISGYVGFAIGGIICEIIVMIFVFTILQVIPENRSLLRLIISRIRRK